MISVSKHLWLCGSEILPVRTLSDERVVFALSLDLLLDLGLLKIWFSLILLM